MAINARSTASLRPGEYYDDRGRLCAPPSSLDPQDFYLRGGGIREGGGRQAAGGAHPPLPSRRGSASTPNKPLPLVARYIPLDLWISTSIMSDSTVDEAKHHFLYLAGLLPPLTLRPELVPSFDALPRNGPKSVFDLLSKKAQPSSVVVSESYGSGFSASSPPATRAAQGSTATSDRESQARPKSTGAAGSGGASAGADEKGRGKERGWSKFSHSIRPSISTSNLRSAFLNQKAGNSTPSYQASNTNASLSSTLASSTTALVPSQPHAALSTPLHPSSSSTSLPPSAPLPSSSSSPPTPVFQPSSVTTTSSFLSDASETDSWSLVGSPSPVSPTPSPFRSRPRTDSATISVRSLASSSAKISFAPDNRPPPPPGIVVQKTSPVTEIPPEGQLGAAAAGRSSSSTAKLSTGKELRSVQAAAKRSNSEYETEKIKAAHDLVHFGTGFLLDKFSIRNLRPGEIVEIQLRSSYLPTPRANPEHYLRPCFQSWCFISSVVGGSTKHSSSSGGAGREDESLTFKRRWLRVEGGEMTAWKTLRDSQDSTPHVLRYAVAGLISLDEFKAPSINSRSLQTMPTKSILCRFSERSEGGVKVETGRVWIRATSQQAHESLLRCLAFAAPWSARTQLSVSPSFDRRLVYLDARNILTQPSWRLKKADYFILVEETAPRECLEWPEDWSFTRVEWNAATGGSRRSTSTRRRETISNAQDLDVVNASRSRGFVERNAPRLSSPPPGTRKSPMAAISDPSSSLARTISNLEMTSTTSLASSTKSLHLFPSVIAEAISSIATLGRSRSASSTGKGHRRSVTASTAREVFEPIERRVEQPVKTAVDASGAQVFLIGGGDEVEPVPSLPNPAEETAAQWSRRMGSKGTELDGEQTIKSRGSSQSSLEKRKTGPPATLAETLGAFTEDPHHRRRQTVTASHFQTPTPFARSSFASVKTVSSAASTSTTSLDTPRDFPPLHHPPQTPSSSSTTSSSTPNRGSPSPFLSSKQANPNKNLLPTPNSPPLPPRTSSIPIPSIPQHRRSDSSALQSILSTSPRATRLIQHTPPPTRSQSATTPIRKLPSSALPLLPPSAFTLHVAPAIPRRHESISPTTATFLPPPPPPAPAVSFGASVLTGGARPAEDSMPYVSGGSTRGRRQSAGSSSSRMMLWDRQPSRPPSPEEPQEVAVLGSSKGKLIKDRGGGLSRKTSVGGELGGRKKKGGPTVYEGLI